MAQPVHLPWRRGWIERVPALVLLLALLGSTGLGAASERASGFEPPGLYSPIVYRLDNGLRVVLKPRHHAPNVAIRAVVGVGMRDYACDRQQVPHYLEHMLFAAVPDLSEADFEQRMFALGTRFNAHTRTTDTVYAFDTHGTRARSVVALLARMLFDGRLTRDALNRTRAVIRREFGGGPSLLMHTLAGAGQGQSALGKALADIAPGYFAACLAGEERIVMKDLRSTYQRYYRPANTTLVLVGDFEPARVRQWIRRVFANYAGAGERDAGIRAAADAAPLAQTYEGAREQAGVGLVARTDGYLGDHAPAALLIRHHLDNRLFQRLRVDNSMAYTPRVELHNADRAGFLALYTPLPEDDHDRALRIMRAETGKLTEGHLRGQAFTRAQQSLLMHRSRSAETNRDFARHYVEHLGELDARGRFLNREAAIAALEPTDVQAAARQLFAPDNRGTLRDTSVSSQKESRVLRLAAIVLALPALVLVIVAFLRARTRDEDADHG